MNMRKFIDEYELKVDGVSFWTPYYMAPVHTKENPNPKPGPLKGKGSPAEITQVLLEELADKRLKDGEEYRKFMHGIGLGVECSGFMYFVLDQALKSRGIRLADCLYKSREQMLEIYDNPVLTPPAGLNRGAVEAYPDAVPLSQIQKDWGNQPRNIADMATIASPLANDCFDDVSGIKPGDMIYMTGHDGIPHAVLVVKVKKDVIEFVHSGGPHGKKDYYGGVEYGSIDITDPAQPIEKQEWHSRFDFVQTTHYFEPKALRRLKVLAGG
ncbi:MAG TPA: hypothetical protein VNA68_01430 [Candidatus Dormibacteraeota bacterium]|nr:hypothetical protein [Candidatus Dormibacteraeota bacterium]